MPNFLKIIRVAAWTVSIVLLFAVAILVGIAPQDRFSSSTPGTGAIRSNEPSPTFTLVDHGGRRVSNTDFQGRPLAVFFGFTHCPDVCPTTLMDLSSMLAEIGPAADRIQVLFITVDPERDTSAVLKGYVTAIDKGFIALTGSADETRKVADGFRVYFKRIEQSGTTGYAMDHTSTVFLMDSRHRFSGTLDLHEDRSMSRAKLKRLAGS